MLRVESRDGTDSLVFGDEHLHLEIAQTLGVQLIFEFEVMFKDSEITLRIARYQARLT